MYLVSVIPTSRIPLPAPQVLTYFTARELKAGSLVLVPLRKKNVPAVVTEIQNITTDQKMAIRKADFELRGISKIISTEPIFNTKQFELAKWVGEYYWSPLGTVVKMMIPDKKQWAVNSKQLTKTMQTLILVPEISRVNNIARQYSANEIAVLHSGLTDKQYFENWLKIKTGDAKTIVGTRLALFASFVNLKEVIIEDEHNVNYKSQQTPRLHARETAIKLAELWNAKLILKSSTPSIEACWLSKNRKIHLAVSSFKFQVPGSIIDLRQELKNGNFSIFSRQLQEKIKAALANKKQMFLFINRRGSSTVLMCRDCGYITKCPNCDVPLVYHLFPIKFLCHHCGHSETPPSLCPNCRGTRIKFFGTGTQKVDAEFKKLFPDTEVARLDSDITKNIQAVGSRTSRGKSDFPNIEQRIIDDFINKKTPVLIGTQIALNALETKFRNLVSKRLGIPLVSMVLADTLLYLPDFRSNERIFQIISQLRNLASENFILQTYSPENQAIKYAIEGNYKKFYSEEIEARKELFYPPFSQLIKLEYRHRDVKKAEQQAKILAEKLKRQISLITNHQSPINILGPSPAFISRVKSKYIWQIILKCKSPIAYRESDYLRLRNKILRLIPPDWIADVDPLQII